MTATQPLAAVDSGPAFDRSSIGGALRGHRNSLGIIRLFLAAAVIVDHAFPLGGYAPTDPVHQLTDGQATLGSLAVAGFFGISGYLVAKSGMSADVMQFLWRRFLRLFPAFWALLVVSALVIGPLFWVLNGGHLGDYFSTDPQGPINYLRNWKLTLNTYGIYDIFTTTTPYGQQVGYSVFNGSLWTLSYEWFCYMLIAVMVVAGVLLRAKVLVPVLAGIFLVLQVVMIVSPGALGAVIPFFADPLLIPLAYTFLSGAAIAVYAKRIPFHAGLGILAFLVVAYTLWKGGFVIFGPPAIAYFFLWLAAVLPKPFQVIGSRNDYSYGIYIYGFLVQQMLSFFHINEWGYILYTALSLVISFALAWLSWHGVEKWAMRLKDWGPGRGLRHWYQWGRKRIHPQERTADTAV